MGHKFQCVRNQHHDYVDFPAQRHQIQMTQVLLGLVPNTQMWSISGTVCLLTATLRLSHCCYCIQYVGPNWARCHLLPEKVLP